MVRITAAVLLAALTLSLRPALAQTEQQQLVDRATLAAQEMLNDTDGKDAQYMLRKARAAMICPRIFRAGFLLGGQGGECVLVARDGAGSWSSPAFYGMGGGSIGFQAGIQDAEVLMLILTDKGLGAIMDNQFKLGADASATFVDLGGGIEGSTTAALRADIVAFTRARGLFAGIALSGSLLGARSEWNQAYYGRSLGARQIVLGMEASNSAADPLRVVLTRYGTHEPTDAAAEQPASDQRIVLAPPAYAGPAQTAPTRRAPVQSQPLPLPPRR